MGRRPFLFLLCSVALACGCASLKSLAAGANEGLPPAPPVTPAQAYQDGLTALTRGDTAAARRSWDLCVASAPPGSRERLDCAVALERLARPGGFEHRE
jgi:hypothetical protein